MECVAIYARVNSNSYANAKILSYSASVVGSVEGGARSIVEHFAAGAEPRAHRGLVQLEAQLSGYKELKEELASSRRNTSRLKGRHIGGKGSRTQSIDARTT